MKTENEKIETESPSTKKMFSYSLGFLVATATTNAYTQGVFYYYEVEVGLPVVLIGISFVIYAIWNMFNDPLLGYLTDKPMKWTTKWGLRFPWVVIGIFPTLLFYLLLYTIPEPLIGQEDPWPLFCYFIIITCLYDTFYSLFTTHLYGGVATHFSSEEERRKFSAINNAIPNILSVPLAFIVPLVVVYGRRDTFILAALISVIIWGIFAVLLIPGIRESDNLKKLFIQSYENSEKKSFWRTMKIGLGRKNFVASLISVTLVVSAGTLYFASGIYLMKDVLKLELFYLIFINLSGFAGFLVGIPIWTHYAKKKGFKKTLQLGLLMMGFTYLTLLWISTLFEVLIVAFIGGITSSCANIMFVPTIADCYDDVATVTGKREEGTLQGIRNFFYRIGIIVQGAVIAAVHIMTGYNPDPNAVQTDLAIWGVRVHSGLIPSILLFIAFLLIYKWYDLEGEKKQAMIAKLREMGL